MNDPREIAGTITFRHLKAGKIHVVSVDAQTLAAARRLRKRGSPLSRNAAKVMLDRAAKRLDARRIHPSELRHSFATWARAEGHIVRPTEGGVPLAEVAAVMGHLTPRTTKVFYEGNEIPPMIALPLRLRHPSDPVPLDVARDTAARSSSAK
jgi:integrase